MTIGNTTYIPSHVPSSSIPTPSIAFLTTLPPPHSRGPSSQNVATSHVHTATARIVVSQNQVSPIVLGGHIPISGSSYDPLHGIPHIPTYGASHGITTTFRPKIRRPSCRIFDTFLSHVRHSDFFLSIEKLSSVI